MFGTFKQKLKACYHIMKAPVIMVTQCHHANDTVNFIIESVIVNKSRGKDDDNAKAGCTECEDD
jgi:hypothetical protein